MSQPSAPENVIVVGAGMAGLACARSLVSRGATVTLLDKGRAVGGRMSTRRRDDATFDHGAQYFTVRSPALRQVVDDLAKVGAVGRFEKELAPSGEPRWAGTPTMRSLPQAMSIGLDVQLGARVTKLWRVGQAWEVELEAGTRLEAARVVVAIPAPQARELLVASAEPVPEALARVEVAPCWALMVEVEGERSERPWTMRDTPPFSWLCRQSDAASRSRWVAHADREFSERFLELSQEEVVEMLSSRVLETIGAARLVSAAAHRWRYARTTEPAGVPAIVLAERRLVLAGDYCLGARVEDAFTSGVMAAALLTAS
jgi:predicted NAD/FAD-dependent oxidoreductase